jgi:serine phosphatase RsbU (regulator of sigma subunit)
VPTPEGWQIAPYYQPAREVGGDFYDFLDLVHDQATFCGTVRCS